MRILLCALLTPLFIYVSMPECTASGYYTTPDGLTENVFVHTDRDIYIAGENMYIKSYLLNSNIKTKSSYIYVALRNETETVKSVILPAENSSYEGSIFLEDTLSTGYYELVAYTNWMRNQGEDLYFRKTVAVINRFDQIYTTSLIEFAETESLEVKFMPESKNFIKGCYNNVLVYTEGDFNAALHDFWIVNQNNDTIKSAKLNRHGFAVLSLKPDSATTYHALIDRVDKRYEMPQAGRGCLINVKEKENNKLNIGLLCSDKNHKVDWLKIKQYDNTVFETNVADSVFNITLSENDIPAGLLSIEAGQHGQNTAAQRLWYFDVKGKPVISVKSDNDSYKQREKINLDIDGKLLNDEYANLSISVIRKETINNNKIRFDSYMRAMNIASAFGYKNRDAVALFGSMDTEELNDYLIGQNSIYSNKNNNNGFHIDYFMETEGIIVSGKVVDAETEEPVYNARVIVNTPDTIINLLYARTNKNGRFHIVLPECFYQRELFFLVEPGSVGNLTNIIIDEKFSDTYSFEAETFILSREQLDFIKDMQNIVRVNKAYDINHLQKVQEKENSKTKQPLILSEINREYYLENYMPLDSLHEIAREIIHSWQMRKRGGEYRSTLTCGSTGRRIAESPVFFLDGIITYDVNKFAHLNSGNIKMIGVHNYQWIYGDMLFPGIISIITNNSDYRSILAHRSRTNLFKESIREPYVFFPPDYNELNEIQKAQPDLRKLLYWNDSIVLEKGMNKEVSFFAGDLKGEYSILIQGITSGGKPININKTVEIK